MKKFITIAITACIVFAIIISATATTHAASPAKKYIRIKQATYMKYKKAYNNQKKLNITIKQQKNTIKQLEAKNAELEARLANLGPNEDIDEIKHRLEQQSDINDWLWMSIRSLGISYENKTWTVPSTFPSTFMINGSSYKVQVAE